MKIVFATHNLNKLKEVQQMLPEHIELLSLSDIECTEEIPETASSLEGNAKIKADHVTKHYGYNCFADDTGLEVTALNGEPGVYSARYAGEPVNAKKNMNKLLKNLEESTERTAQFRTAIALNLSGEQFLFEGICKGEITIDERGEEGFGYDPIFIPIGHQVTFAEMSSEAKNKISHRGLAIQQLVDFLSNYK